jgi:hypothetical protein
VGRDVACIRQKGYSGVICGDYWIGGRGLGKEVYLPGAGDCLGLVSDIELALDAGRVGFDRVQHHDQLPGNFLADLTLGGELEHFHLALA